MIVISDTNILSSFACANALSVLLELFKKAIIAIPPSVYGEIEQGQAQGRSYLDDVLVLVHEHKIQLLHLSKQQTALSTTLPTSFHIGEREAMAISITESAPLLCNDKSVVRYCKRQTTIEILDLADILRLGWIEQIINQEDIEKLLLQMKQKEGLILSKVDYEKIFAPQSE